MNALLVEAIRKMHPTEGDIYRFDVDGRLVELRVVSQFANSKACISPSLSDAVLEDFDEIEVASPDWFPRGTGIPCVVVMGKHPLPDPPILDEPEEER